MIKFSKCKNKVNVVSKFICEYKETVNRRSLIDCEHALNDTLARRCASFVLFKTKLPLSPYQLHYSQTYYYPTLLSAGQ